MEPIHALDGASWLWHPELAEAEPGFVLFRLNVKSARAETVRLQVNWISYIRWRSMAP